MSAYICDRGTIAYLVEAGRRWDTAKTPMAWGGYQLDATGIKLSFAGSFGSQATGLHVLAQGASGPITNHKTPAEVGQMLWDENIRSVFARYPDLIQSHYKRGGTTASLLESGDFPGPCGETFRYSKHRVPPGREVTIPQVISTCENFTYQSCEGGGLWEKSVAYNYIEAQQRQAN